MNMVRRSICAWELLCPHRDPRWRSVTGTKSGMRVPMRNSPLAGKGVWQATVHGQSRTGRWSLLSREEHNRVADVVGGHACLEQVAVPVKLLELRRVEAARRCALGTNLLPQTGRVCRVAEDRIGHHHVYAHAEARALERGDAAELVCAGLGRAVGAEARTRREHVFGRE